MFQKAARLDFRTGGLTFVEGWSLSETLGEQRSKQMSNTTNTTVVNKHIVFLKDDAGWYADMEGTRAQNAMVSGADRDARAKRDGLGR